MRKNFQNPLYGTSLTIAAVLIVFFYGVHEDIRWIVNSIPGFSAGIAAILVGSYAFILYKKQKQDAKKDAANIILLEVQNAEKVLKSAQKPLESNPPSLPNDSITLNTNSWEKNKFLFVGDFENNEWEALSDFYKFCLLFDEAVRTNDSYFQKNEEQNRVNIQKRSAELSIQYEKLINRAKTPADKEKLNQELKAKVFESMTLYLSAGSAYYPQKPINDAKNSLEAIKLNISLSSAISKLKILAKI